MTVTTEVNATVSHRDGEAYTITVRGHQFYVDQPISAGGADTAATPVELFVASLASCVAYYAGRYLTRHGVSREGLTVRAAFDMAIDSPARIAAVRITVDAPALPVERRAALLAVVNHCTVHNTLREPPSVSISVP